MKNNKKAKILLMIMFLMLTLTSCKGKERDQKNVGFEYNKRVESVVIKNEHYDTDGDIYVTFKIVLLNEKKEVLYKEPYDEILIEDEYTVNLEDVKPEWIEYDKIDSMDVEIVKVYDYNVSGVVLITLLAIAFILLIIYIMVSIIVDP